jgi:hypothetical protein
MDALKYLSDQLLEERNRIAEDLSDGKAKDHGEYKYSCGVCAGAIIANSYIYELSKKLEQDDE